MGEHQEDVWPPLLRAIRNDEVVPILGRRIGLTLSADRRPSFEALFAQHLLGVRRRGQAPPGDLLDSIARLRRRRAISEFDLRERVATAIEQSTTQISPRWPAPLGQIAAIDDFRFFVTLAPDGLLARALHEGQRRTLFEAMYAPQLPDSRRPPVDWAPRAGEANLLYLFGKADSGHFALHEEDLVEYAHHLLRGAHGGLQRFVDEVRTRHLLLLGCGFPDWLGRLLLRLMCPSRLSAAEQQIWLVDDPAMSSSLAAFLSSERRGTRVVSDIAPESFIAQLHERWSKLRPAPGSGRDVAPPRPKKPILFVSYARAEDGEAVDRFVSALRQDLGASSDEIWYDRDRLEPGQDFQREIFSGIDACEFFVPIISGASDPLEGRFFRKEWKAAAKKAESFVLRTFVVPVIVDADTRPQDCRLASQFWNLEHYGRAPGGEPDAKLLGWLRQLLAEARARRGASKQ